uniref:PsiF repeat-containing protein n=2 Tax=Gammaproteobacteria TaxID=1236 RepID=A0A3L0X5M9_ECOLX
MQTHHNKERHMKRIAILFGLFCTGALLTGTAFAQDSAQLQCEAQAAAKKLNGAAKTSFVGKCVKDAAGAATGECEKAAADKKLAGAAKNSFIQKCVKTDAATDKAAQCEKAAADKKLAGAAKNSFVQKCVKSA